MILILVLLLLVFFEGMSTYSTMAELLVMCGAFELVLEASLLAFIASH